jgi:hypothetical protein
MFDKFIWQKDDTLSSEFCNALISKFEADSRKTQGITGGGVNLKYKKSTDLSITYYINDYKLEDQTIFNALNKGMIEYDKKYLKTLHPNLTWMNNPYLSLDDTGYQMQRTKVGEYYRWHNDFCVFTQGVRIATFIFYLNDVYEGGETEFVDGTLIKPERGKLIIFPAYWNYHHQGRPPISNTKYIVTGWILVDPNKVPMEQR